MIGGGSSLKTNSVSLLLLDFDFEHEVFDELYLAILKYLNTVSIENISHSELFEFNRKYDSRRSILTRL